MSTTADSSTKTNITETYGSWVFNDAKMRERLPKKVYQSIKKTIDNGESLDPTSADIIANAMKEWALEIGATHYCHWFQPMTGATAEKHDSFISPTTDGRTILEFRGKELVQGEPDASSFPSGGLRATFEARGYTAWDCTSPVFVKNDGTNKTLFIPSAFCSYTGEVLDKKTPLLRSMDSLNTQALRVLKAIGNTSSTRVFATLGGEQEYFLIDQSFVKQRLDLRLSGRTLFGAPSPKGQEMDDHYFGSLDERIASFMNELNNELWKMGISAKTQHNEVSPAQYEIAPIFTTVNVAVDNNQITMETLKKVAARHGLFCTLNEKPFAGLNGSGKHNNWSLSTDDGINLLEPGSTPHDNMQFLTFLIATISAVDKYAKLLRASVATPGNDHRLGANEAPPAIISVFLGDQLNDIYEQLEKGPASNSKQGGNLELGVSTLPNLPKDSTDRNRTSPFAFTGNKFEFRMAASSQSLAGPNFVLNTIVAETLSEIADKLEGASDVNSTLQSLLQSYAKEHKRVIFNGDNYSDAWVKEAEKRGLPNIKNYVDSINSILETENAEVLSKHKVLNQNELAARHEILTEFYSQTINIEAQASLQIAKRQILPASIKFSKGLADTINATKAAGASVTTQTTLLQKVSDLITQLDQGIKKLEEATAGASSVEDFKAAAASYRDQVIPAMNETRDAADQLESIVDAEIWPLPTYAEMLFQR